MNAHPVFWALAALLALVAAWQVIAARRDPERNRARWLAGLRAAAALLLAWTVLQPQSRRSVSEVERPLLGVLVDASESMNDGPPGATRADQVRRWLESPAFQRVREQCDTRIFRIGGELEEAADGELSFDASASRIGRALEEWVARWGTGEAAGMVLLSDGLDSDSAAAPVLPLPCWVLETEAPGATARPRVALWQIEPPRRAVAGAENSVRVVLQGWGVEGREIPVELWADGQKLGEKPARFNRSGETQEVMLPLKPRKPGSHAYEIRVNDPAADPAARSQPIVVPVHQQGRRVLLLSNSLGFEGKFLRRTLLADRNIALDSFARWPDGRWMAAETSDNRTGTVLDLGTAALSTRTAVILDDVSPEALHAGQWQALADYATRGGGLVVLGGPNFLGSAGAVAALGRILPVPVPAPHLDGRFGVRLTDAGLRHPVFGPLFEVVKDFPSLQGANLPSGVASHGQVLMETVADGQARPLVVVSQAGGGRVAVILSDTLWRWRVASPQWSGSRPPFDTFWAQMLAWVSPDQDGLQGSGEIELAAANPTLRTGEKAVLQAEWTGRQPQPDGDLEAAVTDPLGVTRPLLLRRAAWQRPDGRDTKGWRGEIRTSAAGVHQVEAATDATGAAVHRASCRFAVAASPGERRGEAADHAFLRDVARQSGGACFAWGQSGEFLQALPESRRRSERVQVSDIWNHPLALGTLLLLLCVEWWLRRRRGLA